MAAWMSIRRRRNGPYDILDRVGRGEVDILLGTQMIAKGLDFPNVTLVGVIDADAASTCRISGRRAPSSF
jgi:primosomal protein N'